MALPRQVEAKLKELEAIEKQLQPEAETQETTEEQAEAVRKVEENAEPANEVTEPEQEPEVVEAEPAKAEEEPQKPEEDAAVWRQKYKTLQGMYDKEVPRLHAEVKDLKAELSTLSAKLETKEEQKKQLESLVTDEDVKNFGEDLIEVQRKVAKEVAAEYDAKLQAYEAKIAALEQNIGTTQSSVAESSFEAKLHRLVPDFDAVNTDPKWIAWLDEVDPVLRGPRRTVAEQAFTSGDAEGVAYYVDMFKQSMAPEPTPEVEKPNKELERQIQPSRKASSATPTSQKGKVYSASQIASMFKKAVTLSSTGRIDEANKLEAEIDAAYMEGRVSG
jgi:hypothetical protein